MAEFKKIFEHVRDLVLYGDAHLRIWEGLAKEINRENAVVGNTAPTFFGLTLEAHLDRALLNAAKTFDGHRDALNLRKVLNCAGESKRTLAGKNEKRLSELFPEAERQLKEIEANLSAIQTRRDKMIAHLDRKTISDPQKVIADSRITLDQLKEVYAVAWKIIQEVSTIFWNETPLLPLADVDDYEWPLSLIRNEKKRQFDDLRKLNEA
jgi:AbiU2